jgi:hypothetical protein
VAAAAAALALAAPALAAPRLTLLYTRGDAARAIADGGPGLAGIRGTLRQAPIFDDARWPAARQVAKIPASTLVGLDTPQIAATLRRALADPAAGGRAAVDELSGAWGVPELARLRDALLSLGDEAARVVVYVGPGLVGAVGRADDRTPLPARQAALVAALRPAGAVLLAVYHGGGVPFSRGEMAAAATRWVARWTPSDPSALHLLLGPDRGVAPGAVWDAARASAAGRQLLGNGPAVWGLATRQEGLTWLAGYHRFLAAPDAPPPGGDAVVPQGGGLTVTRAGGRRVLVGLARAGRVVVRLEPLAGGPPRAIAKLMGPLAPATVRVPVDVRPGRYRLVAVALGNGLRDEVRLGLRITAAQVRRSREADPGGAPAGAGGP